MLLKAVRRNILQIRIKAIYCTKENISPPYTMHISIIDDEKILANMILKKMRNNGYSASAFYGYQDFMRHGDANSDLYIIDISL